MSRLRELRLLASGLCHDAGIGVEETENQWAWSPDRRVILVARDDLDRMGPVFCAGVIAHEVGHALVSRYTLFERQGPQGFPLGQVLNAVEDTRAECFMASRYPGTRPWMQEASESTHSSQGADPPVAACPLILQFILAAASDHHHDWQSPMQVASPVLDTLRTTANARSQYAIEFLPTSSDNDGSNPEEEYARAVLPSLLDPRDAARSVHEVQVQVFAVRALRHFADHILPQAHDLWQSDLAALTHHLREHPRVVEIYWRTENEERHAVALRSVAESVTAARRDPRRWTLPSIRKEDDPVWNLASRMLEEVLNGKRRRRRVAMQPNRQQQAGGRSRAKSAGDHAYEDAHIIAAPLIDSLVRELEQVLIPRARLGQRTGYRSGVRADLRAVMTAEAHGDGLDRLWVRRTVPNRRRAAFLLLVDLSGSMRGEKIVAALQATVLFTETLHRLKIPCAVHGFQDEVIPFLSFSDSLTAETRARLGEMRLEVIGRRPEGNNFPGANDDGPCLRQVAQQLTKFPANDRVLLVVSDGEPAGSRSDEEDLHEAVRIIRTEMPSIALVGIGIGEDATCVRQFYPDHVVEKSVKELPMRLSSVLRKLIGRNRPVAGRPLRVGVSR